MSEVLQKVPLDLTKDPVAAFYEALSLTNNNGVLLTAKDLAISDVVADSTRVGANTRFTMTPLPGSTKVMGDPLDRWYWRWDMVDAMATMGYHDNKISYTGLPVDWAPGLVHGKAVDMVNLTLGTAFTTDYTTWTDVSRDADALVGILSINDGVLTIFGEIEITVDLL